MPQETNNSSFARMNINKKLCYIQTQLIAAKNNVNQDGNYKYRSAEDILKSLKPYLEQCQCFITLSDEVVVVGDRFYVKTTATLTDSSGASVSTTAMARESEDCFNMQASQITGATSSYARKYALGGLFAIDDGTDADKLNTHGKGAAQSSQPNKFNQANQGPASNQNSQPQDNSQLSNRKSVTDEQLARAIHLMKNNLNDKNGHPVTKNVLINDYHLTEEQYDAVMSA